MLTGFDVESWLFTEEQFATGRKQLVDTMIADFWSAVKSFPYLPNELLMNCLSPMLEKYLLSGVRQDSAFCPLESMALYLHGAAGTGKSTFVSALAQALQSCLHKNLDAEREVKIVKVPLNSVTDWQLKSILTAQVPNLTSVINVPFKT